MLALSVYFAAFTLIARSKTYNILHLGAFSFSLLGGQGTLESAVRDCLIPVAE